MLTLFTIPKPFRGHADIIQRNAIQSWTLLQPRPEIILFGDDEKTAVVAKEFGVIHIPSVARNEYGTPLINDIFSMAQREASYDILCYVNADIILMSDFILALEHFIHFRDKFLVVGQRWDVDIKNNLEFGSCWEDRLRTFVSQNGNMHHQTGIDYFIFPRGLWGKIPPFAIGRTAWDNWLIYRARAKGAAVIDATESIMAIHQNHDYSHISGGIEDAWRGKEAKRNLLLAGSSKRIFTIGDANWLLSAQGLIPAQWPENCQRLKETWPILHPYLHFIKKQIHRLPRLPHYIISVLKHLI